jgi:hypothetical protein
VSALDDSLALLRAYRDKVVDFVVDETERRATAELAALRAEVERLRGVHGSLRDWAQGRVDTLTRCIETAGIAPNTTAEMLYERTIMRDIVAMLDEATP